MGNLNLKQAVRIKNAKLETQWIILLAATFFVGVFFVAPKFIDWQSQFGENISLAKEVILKEEALEATQAEGKRLEARREEASHQYEVKEAQIFPEKIDNGMIAETLELLGLTLSKFEFSQEVPFVIESISFSEPIMDRDNGYKSTKTNLNLQISLENLKDLIRYLQTGNLPKRITEDRMKASYDRIIDQESVFLVLEKNVLPLATVDQLQYNSIPKSDMFSVQMSVSFYTR